MVKICSINKKPILALHVVITLLMFKMKKKSEKLVAQI